MKKSYLTSIATAVPSSPIRQMQIAAFMSQASGMDEEEKRRLEVLYRASGINNRYSVIQDFVFNNEEQRFFFTDSKKGAVPSVEKRMKLYKEKALPLCLEAACESIRHIDKTTITHLITVSCTGMYAPGIDIDITQSLGLRTDIVRTCINFMGCYAVFNAIKVADAFCKADPNAVVLVVAVELCTIHYQNKTEPDAILSNALFGDGAASFILQTGKPKDRKSLQIDSFHCELALDGKDEMSWDISDSGFEMKLSSDVPQFIRMGIKDLLNKLFNKSFCRIADINAFAIHPGGKRILEVIEEEMKIEREKITHSYEVLKKYGNMSSVTILFVIKSILDSGKSDLLQKIVCLAFGPGLTMESILMSAPDADGVIDEETSKSEYQFFE